MLQAIEHAGGWVGETDRTTFGAQAFPDSSRPALSRGSPGSALWGRTLEFMGILPRMEPHPLWLPDTDRWEKQFSIYGLAATRSWLEGFRDSLRDLASCLSLEDGWDGPGSVAPTASGRGALMFIIQLLNSHGRIGAPDVSPTFDGGIDCFWRTENGIATVNFAHSGGMSYYVMSGGSEANGERPVADMYVPTDLLAALEKL